MHGSAWMIFAARFFKFSPTFSWGPSVALILSFGIYAYNETCRHLIQSTHVIAHFTRLNHVVGTYREIIGLAKSEVYINAVNVMECLSIHAVHFTNMVFTITKV